VLRLTFTHFGSFSIRVGGLPGAPPSDDNFSFMERERLKMETAIFAAGCFWGVEAAFRELEGVVSTRVGYSGGWFDNPTYRDVCSGRTGHAESVEVTFDPAKISFDKLLDVFWGIHNPTTLNRQGPDVGSQYRSVIFFRDAEQEAAARASKERLARSGKYSREIVTEIVPATTFWQAEEYHQQYFEKQGVTHCRA
jgi:peptide-methionine (S)-S-oxide reductase